MSHEPVRSMAPTGALVEVGVVFQICTSHG
jgi:hypothetical protein